jgi:hypothetical protein
MVGLLPGCWGNSMWHSIHSIAYAYEPSNINKNNYFNFFVSLGKVLPCEECKEHYDENVKPGELTAALESKETLFRWVYDLHNKVNQQTSVPESKWPSYESVKEMYDNYKTDCNTSPGVCGSGLNNKKKLKVVEQSEDESEFDMKYMIPIILLIIALIISVILNIKNWPVDKVSKRHYGRTY